MVRLIMSGSGEGKTKQLLELMNGAAETETGCMVCIEPTRNMSFNLRHQTRLVDASEFEIDSFKTLRGFTVSYTHLDVYKRQAADSSTPADAAVADAVGDAPLSDEQPVQDTPADAPVPETDDRAAEGQDAGEPETFSVTTADSETDLSLIHI